MKPTIAITIGDFNGIGPEVTLKSIATPSVKKSIRPLLIGSFDLFQYYARKFKVRLELVRVESPGQKIGANAVPVLNVHQVTEKNLQIGKSAPDSGVCAGLALERAVKLCLEKEVDAMVTAPVSKESLHFAGYSFPGQTEMLALLSRSDRVTMMLVAKAMRVGLVTIHIPVKKIAENIFVERIVEKLETVNSTLRTDFGISHPTIAVLALNPHAGENGAIGTEEKEVIIPAITKAIEKKIDAVGPFPADGFFATDNRNSYDAILAMYHDQGLIPLKIMGFHDGVNYSAGLKIIRTSPDHGTGFDIAGKGIANPGSMIAAINLARSIISHRKASQS